MDDDGPDAGTVLAQVRELRQVELAASAALLQQAARWADLHPAPEPSLAATYTERGKDSGMCLGGEGVPGVALDCVAELGAALGMSTTAGERLIGHALELRHRLPRLWSLVHEGRVAAWQARQVAERTLALSRDAAAFVDAQVAGVAGRIGHAQLERLVGAAVLRHMPEEAERRRLDAADRRCFQVEHDATGERHGLSDVFGRLDLPDALALDAAVAEGAHALGRLGSTDSLDVRRARAVGDLARRQPALDLLTTEAVQPGRGAPVGRAAERVVLYVHLSAAALGRHDDGSGRVENTGAVVTAGQIRDWCGRPDARVTVKPVIDLTTDEGVEGYRIPAWMRETVALRDRTCVFPWCSRPAHTYQAGRRRDPEDDEQGWSCDTDHIVAYDAGGPTSTDNLAPLCRTHHRLKTFAGWRYRVTANRTYGWTSPHGWRYARTPDGGTTALEPPPPGQVLDRPCRARSTASRGDIGAGANGPGRTAEGPPR
ncbi:HNH endonuclease signature motif containing protein [Desertihabitans aurantiacus]|uniref:HNH endonuclease signature motif containing protein n=1 Tax=Desertihabitans aurantiacus TaxID=2282477 RepID=UPI000DF7AC6D|nr:HNH endonuclease signature motif containing protein [Desertihabitans aurantiacus]